MCNAFELEDEGVFSRGGAGKGKTLPVVLTHELVAAVMLVNALTRDEYVGVHLELHLEQSGVTVQEE